MKCAACGFEAGDGQFAMIEFWVGGGYGGLIGKDPERNPDRLRIGRGSVDIHVCPSCGTLRCEALITKKVRDTEAG